MHHFINAHSRCTAPRLARHLLATAAASLALLAGAAQAATIETSFANVAGSTWDVSFSVAASPGQTVDAFSVYFDWAKVSNLAVQASPPGWDSIAIQGDSALASDGYFDALALGAGISPGSSLGGFTARFDWADATAPATLSFTVNDPQSFLALENGMTVLAVVNGPVPAVPEPGTWGLMLAGIALLAVGGRRRCR